MRLRPYQREAVEATMAAFEEVGSVLLVMPTGTGKTTVFLHVAERMKADGRVMVLAHREELIFQAAGQHERITGEQADIEMAEMRARAGMFAPGAVISTVQTQLAGGNGGRMTQFDPKDFGLLIVDECHHATAASYRKILKHYQQNPSLKILGVTATPDRMDEAALGQIFETVAFDYELPDAIRDGWLVPIDQQMVHIEGLDYSAVRTTAGDLNGADLARVLEYEETLLQMVAATVEVSCGLPQGTCHRLLREEGAGGPPAHAALGSLLVARPQKTLVFAASVAHAERFAEILNRWIPDSARWVCGKTPKEERRGLLDDYAAARFAYLVNVGVATEGFDEPAIGIVVIARATKSRALYAQMTGRGTRPLPGLVDDEESADMRRLSISVSPKPGLTVLDFLGNAGRHKLVSAADILGGKYSDEVVARAKAKVEAAAATGKPADVVAALDTSERELREIAETAERMRRSKLLAAGAYSTETINPFDVLHIRPWKERGWDKGRPVSDKMSALLARNGINAANMSYIQARQLTQELFRRWDGKLCTFKQAKLLQRRGHDTSSMTKEEATKLIDGYAASEGWPKREKVTA